MKWLRGDCGKGAFKVEQMAKNLGFQRWYNAVYRPQSKISHALDALQHIMPGEETMTIDADIAPNIDQAAMPLYLANDLFLISAHLIDWRFGLKMRNKINGLFQKSLTLVRKT